MTAAGSALIFAASVGISYLLVSERCRRIRAYEALCALVAFIKGNIEAFGTPVDNILENCRIEYFESCDFGEVLRREGLEAASSRRLLPLGIDAELDFEAFAENLGKGYRDEELKRCDYYLSRFDSYLAKEREALARYTPMYRYLPPLGALSVVILLI